MLKYTNMDQVIFKCHLTLWPKHFFSMCYSVPPLPLKKVTYYLNGPLVAKLTVRKVCVCLCVWYRFAWYLKSDIDKNDTMLAAFIVLKKQFWNSLSPIKTSSYCIAQTFSNPKQRNVNPFFLFFKCRYGKILSTQFSPLKLIFTGTPSYLFKDCSNLIYGELNFDTIKDLKHSTYRTVKPFKS